MSTAERIVDVLLESDEPDFKAFLDRNTNEIYNVWEQTGGDVDWWTYGGTFHNPGLGEMVHVVGLEGEGIKDTSHYDFELTDEEMAKINAEYPVKIDPEFPDDGDENERDREMAVEDVQTAKYNEWEANLKVAVYRWTDDFIEDWADKFDEMSNSFGTPISELSLPEQWQAIGEHFGWEELDFSPVKMTKPQIEALLTPFKDKSQPQDQPPGNP